MARVSAMISPVLVLFGCDLCFVRANRPPSPVNVTVTQLKANSATVSWDVPEGDVVIGYAILQQRQDGQMQRFIREVNTTNRACVLWDLAEDADYIIQVQSIGLYGESQASKRVHFRTLKETDRLPSNSSNQGDITMEGLDKDRQLQTGEIIIIVAVLLMWAAVIALFCRQYDIIKDNDSNNNKEKTKPSSEHSTPERPSGGLLRSKVSADGWQQGWQVVSAGACTLHRVWLSPEMETPWLVLSPQRLRIFRVQLSPGLWGSVCAPWVIAGETLEETTRCNS
ncbi:hypothetical protein DV515_00015930 [Chloebia gouldiae]|uniref:Fibronectin type-III domain-containing protein n=1 Tax=Chloebia gouldiae TaxID=44316 RepID=A0A3L8RU66_CHLGU|nr:hypothetical protein DV515_00015930 [Chloebia gouldiae]